MSAGSRCLGARVPSSPVLGMRNFRCVIFVVNGIVFEGVTLPVNNACRMAASRRQAREAGMVVFFNVDKWMRPVADHGK
jgi:hypothetical protein